MSKVGARRMSGRTVMDKFVLNVLILLVLEGLCPAGTERFDPETARRLIAADATHPWDGLQYCLGHPVAAEPFLMEIYPRMTNRTPRLRIIFTLGLIGGDDVLNFLCGIVRTRPGMDPLEQNEVLLAMAAGTSRYDWAAVFRNPEMPDIRERTRDLSISDATRENVLATIDRLERRLRQSNSQSPIIRNSRLQIDQIRRNIEMLAAHQ